VPFFPPIQQEQYPATDETQCIQVKIPAGDEFKALLAGLMVSASDVNNYADPLSPAADGLAAIWDQAYSEIDWNGCPMEGIQNNTTLLHSFAQVVAGNALQQTLDAACLYATYTRQNTPAVNDRVRYWMRLAAGDYTMKILHLRGTTNGIADIYLFAYPSGDDVVITTGWDLYNAATVRNVFTQFSFTVVNSAFYNLDFVTTGKNASSSSYHIPITAIYIEPAP